MVRRFDTRMSSGESKGRYMSSFHDRVDPTSYFFFPDEHPQDVNMSNKATHLIDTPSRYWRSVGLNVH